MDLIISKLIPPYRIPRRGLNEVVSLLLNPCRPGSLSVRFQVYYASGCGFASDLVDALRFCNSDCLHASIRGTSFYFSKVSKLLL